MFTEKPQEAIHKLGVELCPNCYKVLRKHELQCDYCGQKISSGVELLDYEWTPEEIGDTVVFLDVDGVLNCRQTTRTFEGYIFLDEEKMKNLQRMLLYCGSPQVVLSSSWRFDYYDKVEPKEWNLFELVRAELHRFGITISDITVDRSLKRQLEIEVYLERHPQIKHFVILDDKYCRNYIDHQVITNLENGLTYDRVDEMNIKLKK